MPLKDFVNLHVHSDGSLLDGMIQPKKLVEFTLQNKMSAVAITDHGSMLSLIDFYKAAKPTEVKPILGVEFYLVDNYLDKSPQERFHLTLLAETNEGYRNLLYLTSIANREGFYQKPRISKVLLEKHHKGLICLTGCLSGELSRAILIQHSLATGTPTDFKKEFYESVLVKQHLSPEDILNSYVTIFGRENVYMEVMDNGLPNQSISNDYIFSLAKRTGVKPVLTPDAHYLFPEDQSIHEILLAIQTGSKMSDPTKAQLLALPEEDRKGLKSRMSMADGKAHLYTIEYVNNLIAKDDRFLDAANSTLEIAKRCNVSLRKSYSLPDFSTEKKTADEVLAIRAKKGLVSRFGGKVSDVPQEYRDRIEYELSVIKEMGFSNYFLVVAEYCKWAAENNILVGVGRGSAAGSVVVWSLGITKIDPIKWNLNFARFLNKGRKESLPDIDLDFSPEDRPRVIKYLSERFGEEHVAEICTFQPLYAKAAIRDVARVLGYPISLADETAKKVPDPGRGKTPTFEFADKDPEWNTFLKYNREANHIVSIARKLEGIKKTVSLHAGGVIISGDPISKRAPVMRILDDEKFITGYEMKGCEEVGLVKFDILRVSAIQTITDTINSIWKQTGQQIDINSIPLDDPEVFKLFQAGKTEGLFQFDSTESSSKSTITGLAIDIKVDSIQKLCDILALYRPGILDNNFEQIYLRERKKELDVE